MEKTIERLKKSYKLYYLVSSNLKGDSDAYAEESANSFIEYYDSCNENYSWNDKQAVIENQIRVLRGLIAIYDKPIVRDKITQKTRWCL